MKHVLVFLQRPGNLILIGALAGCIAYLEAVHALPWGWLLAGMVIFEAMEYGVHRFVHWWKSRVHFGHHEQPASLDLVFLPAPMHLVMLPLHGYAYLALTGDLLATAALLAGNLVGLLYYEWVHYVAHIPVVPMTRWGRWMKKIHLLHHHKNEAFYFGVSTPLFDVLFGTWKRPDRLSSSGTAKRPG